MGNEQFDKLMEAINSLDNKICSRMDKIEEQNNTIISDMRNLQANFKNLSESHVELNQVNLEINNLKQCVLSSDVIVTGIPYVQGENTVDIVKLVFKQYKLDLSATDYKSIYRLRNRTSASLYSPICIELFSRTLKGALMLQQKKFGPLLLQHLDSNLAKSDKRKVYFKDRLTPYNNNLLAEAKKFCIENHYKYVWFQNCDILVKKTDTSKPAKIVITSDLLKLKNTVE